MHIALCLFSLDVFAASQSSDTLLEGGLSTIKSCVYAYIDRVVRLALDMPETLPPTKEKLKAFLAQEYLSAGEVN